MNLGIGLKRLMASVLVAGGLVAPAMGQDCDGNGVRDRLECGPVGWTPGMNNTDGILEIETTDNFAIGVVSSQLASVLNGGRYTIDFWLNQTTDTLGRGLCVIGNRASRQGISMWIDPSSGSLVWNNFNHQVSASSSFPPDGQWHHWAVTYDINSFPQFRMYRDGVDVASEFIGSINLSIPVGTSIWLGRDDIRGPFGGGIDEFRIWNRPLTQAEIAGLQDVYMDQDFGAYPGLRVYHAFSPATGVLSDPFGVMPLNHGNVNTVSIHCPPDSNGNGVPDQCETDADGDGIDDSMQLSPLPGTQRFRFFDRPQAMTRLTQSGGIGGLVPVGSSFTLEMWVYRSTKTGDQEFLIDHGDQATTLRNLHIGFRVGDEFVMGFWGNDLETTQSYPPDGQWHHWACTYDSNTLVRKIYRDGQLVAQDVSSAPYNPSNETSVIGALRDPRFPFHGAMDELRVWNRVLGQGEIQAGMYQVLDVQSPFPTNLWSYISFNENDPHDDVIGTTELGLSWTPTSLDGILVPQVVVAGSDCNGNGVADSFDIASGNSGDCNANGIPDECEPDCNGNGVPDDCDLLDGTEFDCNGNGVIDSCDIADGTSEDCNNDGIPDECQSDLDADGNGIIDSCDCNGDGILNAMQLSPVEGGGYFRDFDQPGMNQSLVQSTSGQGINLANTSFTVEAWLFRSGSGGVEEYYFDHGNEGIALRNLVIGFRADSRFTMAFWADDLETTQSYPPDGQWHHWACTYDASTLERKVYRDGQLVAQDFSTAPYSPTVDTLQVGMLRRFPFPYHGAIDELRVWGRALSASEIQDRMFESVHEPTMGVPDPYADLLAYFSFDEPDPAQDVIGLPNDPGGAVWIPTADDPMALPRVIEASIDCNADGVPDECQPELDADGNGIIDSCEAVLNVTRGVRYGQLDSAISDANDGDILELAPINHTTSDGTFIIQNQSITLRGTDPSDLDVVRATTIDSSIYMNPGDPSTVVLQGIAPQYINIQAENSTTPEVVIDRCWVDPSPIGPSGTGAAIDVYALEGRLLISNSTLANADWGVGMFGGEGPVQVDIVQSRIVNCVEGIRVGVGDGFIPRDPTVTINHTLVTVDPLAAAPMGVVSEVGSTFITNSIVRGAVQGLGGTIVFDGPSNVLGATAPNVIDDDPMFVDEDGADDNLSTIEDNDYRLLGGSTSIDFGDAALAAGDERDLDGDGDTSEALPLDFDGNARVVDAGLDLGPYEYQGPPPCPADLNGDGVLNFFDVSAFLSAYNAEDPAADFTGDGQYNFFDVSAFLSAFNAGCP